MKFTYALIGFLLILSITYELNLLFYIALFISSPFIVTALYKYIPVMYFYFNITGGKVIGIPNTVSEHWMPQDGPTCAIAAQRIVLKIFNIKKSLKDLSERQAAYGHYKKDLGSNSLSFLLKGYGIETEEVSIQEKLFEYILWKNLRKNRPLIVAVNSYVLNNPDEFKIDYKEATPDHAIIISGIQERNREFIIYYSDTGMIDGSLKTIKSKALLQSISKKTYSMIATSTVPDKYINTLDKITNSSKKMDEKTIINCPSCNHKLRVPKKNIIVTCVNCKNKFNYSP